MQASEAAGFPGPAHTGHMAKGCGQAGSGRRGPHPESGPCILARPPDVLHARAPTPRTQCPSGASPPPPFRPSAGGHLHQSPAAPQVQGGGFPSGGPVPAPEGKSVGDPGDVGGRLNVACVHWPAAQGAQAGTDPLAKGPRLARCTRPFSPFPPLVCARNPTSPPPPSCPITHKKHAQMYRYEGTLSRDSFLHWATEAYEASPGAKVPQPPPAFRLLMEPLYSYVDGRVRTPRDVVCLFRSQGARSEWQDRGRMRGTTCIQPTALVRGWPVSSLRQRAPTATHPALRRWAQRWECSWGPRS